MSDITTAAGRTSLLVTPIDFTGSVITPSTGQTVVLATFKAIAAGTGYSTNDILILRQTPPAAAEYYNATTNTVIGTPPSSDLGAIGSSSVSITGSLPTGTNAIGSVIVTSSPLPTGASTSALQTTGNTSLATIATSTSNIPPQGQALAAASLPVVLTAAQVTTLTPPTSVGITGNLPAYATTPTFNIGTTPTIPVSGTFWQATQPVSIATLPSLATGSNVIGSISNTSFGISGTLPAFAATPTVNIGTAPTIAVTGTFWQATQPVSLASLPALATGSNVIGSISNTSFGVSSLPSIPTGANTIGAISNTTFTATQATGTNLHTVVDSGSIGLATGSNVIGSISNTTFASTQSGAWTVVDTGAVTTAAPTYINGTNNSLSLNLAGGLRVDPSGVTSPVSLASLPALSTGTNTIGSVKLTDGTSTSTILNLTNSKALSVGIVDATGNQITSFGGGAGTVVLGTFKAINAGTGYSINDIIILRQTAPAAPEYYNATTNTVIGTPLPADIGSVSASSNVSVVSALPTGANTIGAISNTAFTANAGTNLNTSALAVESGGNLASINTKVPSGLTVTSTRLLTDGSGVTQPVSAASLPLPTNASTSALQTSGNASLTSIDGKTPALGQALAANSVPVVLTDAQVSTLTPLSSVGITGSVAVTGTFFQGTQPVSLASLPALATGANVIGSISNTSFAATQSGTWNIGSVTTLPSLPTGSNTIGSVRLVDGAVQATVLDLTNSNPLSVGIVDGSGNQITSFGGGTQYATGTTQATPTGTLALGYDGTVLRAASSDSSGNLNVNVVSGGVGGIQYNDGAARGSATGTLALGDDGTNVQTISVDSSGRQNVIVATALPTGSNVIGNVGINGTLPAFASTPTVNIGTAPAISLATGANAIGSISNTAFTANAGTNLNTSLLALESGGNLATIAGRLPTALGQQAASTSLSIAQANEQVQDLYITGQGSQTASDNNVILAAAGAGSTDTMPTGSASYRSVYLHIVPAAGTVTAGAITFEGSNDNFASTANPLLLYDLASQVQAPLSNYTIAATTPRYFAGNTTFRYIRARISTGITGTTTGIQCFTRLGITTYTALISTVTQPSADGLHVSLSAINGNATVQGGLNGTLAVGGSAAIGADRNTNPLPAGGVDINSLMRLNLLTPQGKVVTTGSGELVEQFSVGTGAAVVTDGTNGKTFHVLSREGDVYLEISAISTTPTMQLEGSFDNVNFSVLPMSRMDNTAVSQQYTAQAAFTPVAGGIYRGKSFGFPILRVHLVAGTVTNTIGTIRVIPREEVSGQTTSFFTLSAANTTEAVGSANGQVQAGGVRTLQISAVNNTKAILQLEAVTGTLTYALEGSLDNTTWTALSLQPIGGGATVTSVAATGTSALPQTGLFEVHLGSNIAVRARCTAFTSGVAIGSLKLIQGADNSLAPQRQTTLTQLTAPGATASVAMTGFNKAYIQVLIASINTNVVVRIEGSADNTNWTNLSAANTDTTFTANGTYSFLFQGCPSFVRVNFVSESGGTTATLNCIVRVSQ